MIYCSNDVEMAIFFYSIVRWICYKRENNNFRLWRVPKPEGLLCQLHSLSNREVLNVHFLWIQRVFLHQTPKRTDSISMWIRRKHKYTTRLSIFSLKSPMLYGGNWTYSVVNSVFCSVLWIAARRRYSAILLRIRNEKNEEKKQSDGSVEWNGG